MRGEPLVLRNCRLFDGDHGHGYHRFRVTVQDSRIVSVEKDDDSAVAGTVDLDGMTLMPGLIDAHYHCNAPSLDVGASDKMLPSLMAQHARSYLEQALAAGWTTVRDAAGADRGLVTAIEQGLILGPRLLPAGRGLSQSGGHGDFAVGYSICDCGPYSGYLAQVVDGEESIRRLVREQLRDGATQIKIFASGGVLSPSDPIWMDQFTDGEIRAAVEEAARWRSYVMAHAVSATSIRRCARLGVRSIEHGLQVDAETADLVAASESFIVPTLAAYNVLTRPEVSLPDWALVKLHEVGEWAVASLQACRAAGVRLGLGTDLLGSCHGREHEELLLRSAVCGALETLRSATRINAAIFGLESEIGSIVAGARADLLIVDGDPVADIALLTPERAGIKAVMTDGKVVHGRLPAAS